MDSKRLHFATVVAPPSYTSWSQAYNAGNLFAVLSLTGKEDSLKGEINPLALLGKDALSTLEAEYFTLETKNLTSIKQAITTASEKLIATKELTVSFIVTTIMENVLYAFIAGEGKVIVKRGDKYGTILANEDNTPLAAASGYLRHHDIIVLETVQFSKVIQKDTLMKALEQSDPTVIAETLSPLVHQSNEGGAGALIISYNEPSTSPLLAQVEEQEEISTNEDIAAPKQRSIIGFRYIAATSHTIRSFIGQYLSHLTHKKKLILSLVLAVGVVLVMSIFFAVKKQEDEKTKAAFEQVYSQAQKHYDEGQGLIGLNKALARDDLTKAQKILEDNEEKFKDGSQERKQIDELLKKVNEAIAVSSGINNVDVKETTPPNDSLLAFSLANKDALYVTQDATNFYGLTQDEVFTINKKTEAKKSIIKNTDDWAEVSGLGAYLGNVYVLDKENATILKFAGSSFGKSNYLTSEVPDLKDATSLAIDGSIWVLLQDGTVKKFTRGKLDDFSISGLDKPLSNPTRIATNSDTDNVYILDNGNSRIIVFTKNGTFQAQYVTKVAKDGKEIEVLEKEKKIYILSQDKVWQIDLK